MNEIVLSQASKLANTFGITGNSRELVDTLKSTAFKGQVSDAQMTALLLVAGQYGLNPFTREIYAFPDKSNGIVPVVGVDGWSRIINSHPQFDGIEFEQDEQSCTCIIFRKDRNRPIKVTEWMAECKRGTGPWQSHPKRMLRHKAMIQCARLAFGYGGIYDQDEAERIAEAQQPTRQPVDMGPAEVVEQPEWPADRWAAGLPKWVKGIADGKPLEDVLAWLKSKGRVTAEQEQQLRAEVAKLQQPVQPAASEAPQVDPNKLAADMQACNDLDKLYELAGLMEAITDEAAKLRIEEIFAAKQAELEQA